MPTRQDLFANGRTFIRHVWTPGKPQAAVVVTFAEMHMNDPDKPGFSEEFLSRNGYDMVVVQKNAETWYQDLSLEAFRQAVAPVTRHYDRCASYGVSMGAYAALYFSGAVGARALAISPLVSIHPRHPSLGHRSFRESVPFEHCGFGDVPRTADGTMIIYDPRIKADTLYVTTEIAPHFPACQIMPAPFLGHPCSHALQEMKALRSLVFDFLEARPIAFRTLVRAGRRASPAYFRNIVRHLIRRRRFALADRLLAEAQLLHPAAPAIEEVAAMARAR